MRRGPAFLTKPHESATVDVLGVSGLRHRARRIPGAAPPALLPCPLVAAGHELGAGAAGACRSSSPSTLESEADHVADDVATHDL